MRTARFDLSTVRSLAHLLLVAIALWLSPAAVSGSPAASGRDTGIVTALETIHAVGPEGRGNVAAARAWKKLVKIAGPRDIPRLLAELDGANELAANWIRGAIDTIAEHGLARGGTLPEARLEEFVLEKSHAPRARRLAFEWLIQADRAAEERLIPGMLDDPGVEFRRDAVEHWWRRAEAANEEGDAAIATYRRLLNAARDVDQVNRIRKRLKELGAEVDLRRHFGYVTEWRLIGPFDNAGERGLETEYPPEREIELEARYQGKSKKVRWIEHTTRHDYGKVDLNRALGRAKGVLAYAYSEFWSENERDAEVRLSTVNAWKLWLNGNLLYTRNEYHHGTQFDHYRVKAKLEAGRNVILLKVCQNELREKYADPWKFQLRVCDATGTAILSAGRGGQHAGSPEKRRRDDDGRKRQRERGRRER